MTWERIVANFLVGFCTALAAATAAGALPQAFWFAFLNAVFVGGLAAAREYLWEHDYELPKLLNKGLVF